MKNLIVCADGTWNTPDQEDNGIPAPTNVVKLRNCLASAGPGGEQLCYYHTGVGTEGGLLQRTAGGAWGHGLSKNIQSGYHWLAQQYEPGDGIYLFGFSRGAYTVRSLGGLLNKFGLPDLRELQPGEGWRRIEVVYQQGYRKSLARDTWAQDWPFLHESAAPIRFLGVWDTVGAMGIPDDLAILNLLDRPQNWRFHDTSLGGNVQTARHAVALDEVRASFTPTLWTKHQEVSDLEQIWFPGVHSDIGGGYAETGLSDGALKWMIDAATDAGLEFIPELVDQVRPDPLAVLHDSMRGIFKAHRSRPRNTPAITCATGDIHASALTRHKTPPISQAPYRPTVVMQPGDVRAVDIFAREHWCETGLYLPPGKYQFKAQGEWLDASIPTGPRGASDGEFHIGEVAHVIGSGIGWLERGWQSVTGNEGADFKMTRRHEQWDWFALVGALANSNRKPVSDGTPPPHQSFLIGNQTTRTFKRPGYFYAYANDAWDFYDNNHGCVQVTVTRIA